MCVLSSTPPFIFALLIDYSLSIYVRGSNGTSATSLCVFVSMYNWLDGRLARIVMTDQGGAREGIHI